MFTVVTSYKGKRFSVFTRKIKLSYVQKCGVRFALLKLKSPKHINWEKVKKALGKSCVRVVFQNGLVPSVKSGILPYDASLYSKELMRTGLEALLKQNQAAAATKTAVLIDINCKFQAFADVLVRYFGTVRIVTNECELYQNYVDLKLYQNGAAVIIVSVSKTPGDTSLYVSPDDVVFPYMKASHIPNVLSEPPININNIPYLICSFRCKIPQIYQDILIDGVDEHLFQGAIYECCGIRSLGKRIPDRVFFDGRWVNLLENNISLFFLDKI